MYKKLLLIFVFVVLGALSFGIAHIAFSRAQELNVLSSTPPQTLPLVHIAPQFSISEKIDAGVSLLSHTQSLLYTTKKVAGKQVVIDKQIALAILNTNTGDVYERKFWVSDDAIQKYAKTRTLSLEAIPNSMDMSTIQVDWWNSFNSTFSFPGKPELIVIANKYPVPSTGISDLPEKSKNLLTDIIYVPYSPYLQKPEVVEVGRQYLNKTIDQAYKELDSQHVMSHDNQAKAITSAISKDLVKNILLIEHMDPQLFSASADQGKSLSERVLTIVGTNRERAFRYTGSKAGANGIAQFIESTYTIMRTQYPEAKLNKNYILGMADHVNAVKAMVLFFDSHTQQLEKGIQATNIGSEIGVSDEMLAAAYNGGPSKVVRSVKALGESWFTGQIDSKKPIFRQETIDYLRKFQAISVLHIL